jgi:hypothetical protein
MLCFVGGATLISYVISNLIFAFILCHITCFSCSYIPQGNTLSQNHRCMRVVSAVAKYNCAYAYAGVEVLPLSKHPAQLHRWPVRSERGSFTPVLGGRTV